MNTADTHRDRTRVCPKCGQNLDRIGLDKIAYTNDACNCCEFAYSHVVTQSWHKACLVVYLTEYPEQQTDYRHLPDQLSDAGEAGSK